MNEFSDNFSSNTTLRNGTQFEIMTNIRILTAKIQKKINKANSTNVVTFFNDTKNSRFTLLSPIFISNNKHFL